MEKLKSVVQVDNNKYLFITINNNYFINTVRTDNYIKYFIKLFNENVNEYVIDNLYVKYKNKFTGDVLINENCVTKLKPIKDITNYLDVILIGKK